jgi:hypothetical protein
MKWFPSFRQRAAVDVRRRQVRPALESLESRIVPQASGVIFYNSGAANATAAINAVGPSPQMRLSKDMDLMQMGWLDVNAGAQLWTNAINVKDLNNAIDVMLYGYGLLDVAARDLTLNMAEFLTTSSSGYSSFGYYGLLPNNGLGGMGHGLGGNGLGGDGGFGGYGLEQMGGFGGNVLVGMDGGLGFGLGGLGGG